MIEDPYLANDFELLFISNKSKTNKLILLYDMYSECTIINIISHHNSVIYLYLYRFENINPQSLECWFKSR